METNNNKQLKFSILVKYKHIWMKNGFHYINDNSQPIENIHRVGYNII